jgi:3-methylcrotonyl-CoA carboxylase alpha subunit
MYQRTDRTMISAPKHHGGEGQGVEGRLVAPMPGRVVAWLAEPGSDVEKGAPLLILEAMKMEHTITAPSAGKLEGFRFAVGEQVTEGAELVDFVKSE